MFHNHYDRNRPLLGVDLSPRMVAIAGERLKSGGQVLVGDIRDLSNIDSASAAAVINFFAIHHLDPEGVHEAVKEWCRVLCCGGQLLVAAWEGAGTIDYGDGSDIVALRYTSTELCSCAQEVGFAVSRCVVESVEDFPMDAVHLECTK